MYRKTNKKMTDQLLMILSGLAILGDLVVMGWIYRGSFSGGSTPPRGGRLVLFHSTYKEYRGTT